MHDSTEAPWAGGDPGPAAGPGPDGTGSSSLEAEIARAEPGAGVLSDGVDGVAGVDAGAAAPASGRASREDVEQLTVVSFSHAVQHFYPAGLAVAYPFVVSGLHVSYGLLGLVLGIAGVVGGLLQGLAALASRFSARLLLSVQNFGLAVSSVLGAVAPGFALFGAARCIGNAVSWPQHPVGSAVLTRRFPTRRAYALSWHVAGGSIGTAVIPLVVSALIASYGWRVGVGFLAIPLAIGGTLVAWRLRDTHAGAEHAAADHAAAGHAGERGTARAGARAHLESIRALFGRRETAGAILAGTIAAGGRGLGTLTVFVPAYLKSGLHLGTVTVGALFTALLVGSILGPVVAGYVADRLGRRRVLVAVYVVGAATIVGLVSVGADVAMLGVVGFLVGVFAYSESPLIQAVFSEGLAGLDVQGSFGYYFAISYGVGSLWTIGLGAIIDTAGFHWAFFTMALSFVGAAAVVAWARPVVRPGATPRPGSER